MNKNVLVKISISGSLAVFTTYDREHGQQGRFLIDSSTVRKALSTGYNPVIACDLHNFAEMYTDEANLVMRFTWLHDSHGGLAGFTQQVSIPIETLERVLNRGENARVLYREPIFDSHIKTVGVKVPKNPIKRRALSKALRRNFKWRDKEVTLYPDFDGFFFRAENGLCGGLIPHTYTLKTRNKFGRLITREGLRYEVHT